MQIRRERTLRGRPLSACSGTGVFVGYASLFGKRDAAGDVVMPGAFARSLTRKGSRDIRMLFQHNPAEPIGTWLEMHENDRGLHVRGRLDCNVQRGRELMSLLESGGLDGLSIGFKTLRAGRDRLSGSRLLHEVDLWEISLVTFPMLGEARVSDVKNAAEQLFAGLTASARFPAKCEHFAAEETRKVNNSEHVLVAKPLRTLAGHALMPRTGTEGPPSLAQLFRDGARLIQQGVN